jgi:hypothetical protein
MNDNSQNMRYVFNIYGRVGFCKDLNQRSVPILDDPKQYKVAIESFSLKSSQNFGGITKLIFQTNSIPTVQTNLSGDSNIQTKILGEYVLSKLESDALNFNLSFMADNYMFYGLDSNSPLYMLDLFVMKQDSTGVITPVIVDVSSGITLTLLFQKV